MHTSRMHTIRSSSRLLGGVCQGVCLTRGLSAREVSAWGVCLPWGCIHSPL